MVAREICFVKKFFIFLFALFLVHFLELRKMSEEPPQSQQYQRQGLPEKPGHASG